MSSYTIGHFSLMHGFMYLGVVGLCFLVVGALLWLAAWINHRWQHRNTKAEDDRPEIAPPTHQHFTRFAVNSPRMTGEICGQTPAAQQRGTVHRSF